jgi:hypothetical protein
LDTLTHPVVSIDWGADTALAVNDAGTGQVADILPRTGRRLPEEESALVGFVGPHLARKVVVMRLTLNTKGIWKCSLLSVLLVVRPAEVPRRHYEHRSVNR